MALPRAYVGMKKAQPELMRAYEDFGRACASSGPLDKKLVALVKLGISMGAGLEGAAHSHARKALAAGWSGDELLHAAQLCAPTIGFPTMMRARQWVAEIVEAGASGKRARKKR